MSNLQPIASNACGWVMSHVWMSHVTHIFVKQKRQTSNLQPIALVNALDVWRFCLTNMCVTWLIQTCDMTHPHAWLHFKQTKCIRRLTFENMCQAQSRRRHPQQGLGNGVVSRAGHCMAPSRVRAPGIYIYIYFFFECVCDMTHSVVWHDLFRCAIGWEMVWCHVQDMAWRYFVFVGLVSFGVFWIMCVTWLIQTCDMTHPHVWHDLFRCAVGWEMECCHVQDMAWHHLVFVRRGNIFVLFCWLIHTCDVTYSYVWHDTFIRVTWLIHTCDMTRSYV